MESKSLPTLRDGNGLQIVEAEHGLESVSAVEASSGKNQEANEDWETASESIVLASSLMVECKEELSPANLETAIFLLREALNSCSENCAHRLDILGDLASALVMRFIHSDQPNDITESMLFRGQILGESTDSEAQDLTVVNTAANEQDDGDMLDNIEVAKTSLIDFFEASSLDAINTVIFLLENSLTNRLLTASQKFTAFTTLADGLYIRFHHSHDISDLDNAISNLRDALGHCIQRNLGKRPVIYLRICAMLAARFDSTRDIVDLQTALSHFVDIEIPEAEIDTELLGNLAFAECLYQQFRDVSSNLDDLNTAIAFFRTGIARLPTGGENYSTTLNNLASALVDRFEVGYQETRQSDLEEAISLYRDVIDFQPPPHPFRSRSFNNLALALGSRFSFGGLGSDLDEAISLHREALILRPPPDPNRPFSLVNLANSLSTRYEKGGDRKDLEEAILLQRQALELFPHSHPNRHHALGNLGSALGDRFHIERQKRDLDEAIILQRQAFNLRPQPHLNHPNSLNNLSVALFARFQVEGSLDDLDEAISLDREALGLLPQLHRHRPESVSNLGILLLARFGKRNRADDLDEAIYLHRQSLDLRPHPHPTRFNSLRQLAEAVSTRYEQRNQKGDLDEAVLLYRLSLELRPPPHPDASYTLTGLGRLLMRAHTQSVDDSDYMTEAMSSFSAATQCISLTPTQKVRAARAWSDYADLHRHPSAIAAYGYLLQILPELAALSLDIQSRQEALTARSDGLARKAASCAIRLENLEKAVEFLETGRAIFWGQTLHLRSPFDDLRKVAPELGQRLQDVATALEHGSRRDAFAETLDNRRKLSLEAEESRLASIEAKWTNTLDEVRKLKRFENFMKPRDFSSLRAAANEGPVVMLVSNDFCSDCLILTSTTVHHIALPSLPTEELHKLVYLIQAAASHSEIQRSTIEDGLETTSTLTPDVAEIIRNWMHIEEERGMRLEGNHIPSDAIFKSVLKTLWKEVVKPVIDFLDLQSESPPVLHWCPTGLFTFLPIHAAGSYDTVSTTECTSDYITSSYTPTLGIRCDPTTEAPQSSQKFKMMVIVDSKRLAYTRLELERIKAHAPSDYLVELGTAAAPANVEAVLSGLSTASIVHFACHGMQHRSKPLNSALLVEDGQVTISRIMQQPLPNGSLAFLGACETAMGDGNLPDEAISLGASLLFSGFRSVVATMWEMHDEDGPTISDAFYKEIFHDFEDKSSQIRDSAKALHIAVKKLRAKNVSFSRWVPFVHMGK
ncbi:hypothetical protein GALMADRAFT_105794 [Galerina marginata CBS 339.88]|uniref:CHAT domain-containing protein n=1 Tax=Galerina marginata (strain CBS 339.88) TaxID=685588 RepID=A0A067SC42_GALM3|nr:hypothetical protein GALMADRAFT_105794 [Galerina marginata CBS 339.88]